jgi:hypothetical protein
MEAIFLFRLHQLKGRYEIGQKKHYKEHWDSPMVTLRRLFLFQASIVKR